MNEMTGTQPQQPTDRPDLSQMAVMELLRELDRLWQERLRMQQEPPQGDVWRVTEYRYE